MPKATFASACVIIAIASDERRVVIISQDTRPARPAVPSLSSAIPTATPIAKSHDILSMRAAPALIKKKPKISTVPVISPPCITCGESA